MTREVLVLAHTGRHDAVEAAAAVVTRLASAGLTPVMLEKDIDSLARLLARSSRTPRSQWQGGRCPWSGARWAWSSAGTAPSCGPLTWSGRQTFR